MGGGERKNFCLQGATFFRPLSPQPPLAPSESPQINGHYIEMKAQDRAYNLA